MKNVNFGVEDELSWLLYDWAYKHVHKIFLLFPVLKQCNTAVVNLSEPSSDADIVGSGLELNKGQLIKYLSFSHQILVLSSINILPSISLSQYKTRMSFVWIFGFIFTARNLRVGSYLPSFVISLFALTLFPSDRCHFHLDFTFLVCFGSNS